MSSSEGPASSTSSRRSRRGCQRCRARRQKCDEKRPSCSYCLSIDEQCSYRLNLRWGGRDFGQSRFGSCEVKKIATGHGSFVYSTKDPSRALLDGFKGDQAPNLGRQPKTISLSNVLSLVPEVAPKLQYLVDYFIKKGSAAISPHQRLQEDTCGALVPLSLESKSLLYAISAFSAAQLASYTTDQSIRASLQKEENDAREMCIRILREEIASFKNARPTAVMASSLLLCVSALYYPNDDYNSWRIYYRGIKAAFPVAFDLSHHISLDRRLAEFLQMRFLVLETIVAFSPGGPEAPYDISEFSDIYQQAPFHSHDDHISSRTSLFRMLRTISKISKEKRKAQRSTDHEPKPTDSYFREKGDALESLILQMIERNRISLPVSLQSDQEHLDAQQMKDFIICHGIYEYMGLLHIRTQIHNYTLHDPCVQEAVKKIISLTSQVKMRPGLSPSLGLNTALFPAGQYALPEDQPVIRSLLKDMYKATHNRNCMVTLESLEMHWRGADLSQEALKGRDFIPY